MHQYLRYLHRALMAATVAVAVQPALANAYPDKPIRLVVPGPPGGGTDIYGRMVAEGLQKQVGQTVVVENKPGASGMLGAEHVLKAPADGYTLFMAFSATLTSNQWLYSKITYDPLKDFVPVAAFAEVPNVLLVNPSVAANTVKELVALAKSRPGELNYASSYPGSMSHLSMELFKQVADMDIKHIPFNGDAPSVTALTGGHVQIMITNTANSLGMIETGRLRPLAVVAGKRVSVLPNVPTFADSGMPGVDTTLWYGVVAAAGTPPDIVKKLNGAIQAALQTPEMQERLARTGSQPMLMSPDEFGQRIKVDAEKLGSVIKSANITMD